MTHKIVVSLTLGFFCNSNFFKYNLENDEEILFATMINLFCIPTYMMVYTAKTKIIFQHVLQVINVIPKSEMINNISFSSHYLNLFTLFIKFL